MQPRATAPSRLIVAYFDETKKLQDVGKSVVFAGCAAEVGDWDEFMNRWQETVAGTGVRAVKFSAALACRDDFYSWRGRERERDELLFRLAVVIHEAPIVKISSPILAGQFEALPEAKRLQLRDPQYCGFELCVNGLLSHYPADYLHVACDLTEDFAEGCIGLFNRLRKRSPEAKKRLCAIMFGDDAQCPPLQAADMVAYCARAIEERAAFGVEVPAIVQRIHELFSSRRENTHYYVYRAGAGLGSAERDSVA